MAKQRQLRCLIAAGGTVGHVAPSLAVAEALRARGVEVTFAGSPDRVEARLVPERGYAFDAFRVAGFPRRPGLRQLRAFGLAAAAPVACLRIIERRRPDVVLGGGGYVGGPMVFAAWLRRVPAALTEADAHVGLANRLATPFVQRLFLAYPDAAADGKSRVVGRPIPQLPRGLAGRGASTARPARGRARRARVRRQPGCAHAERDRRRRMGRIGAGRPAPERRAGLRRAARPRAARRLPAAPRSSTTSALRSAPPTSSSRAQAAPCGSSRRPGGPAILVPYPHATATIRQRTPSTSSARAARVVVQDADARSCRGRRRAARRSRYAPAHGRCHARRREARCCRPDRR